MRVYLIILFACIAENLLAQQFTAEKKNALSLSVYGITTYAAPWFYAKQYKGFEDNPITAGYLRNFKINYYRGINKRFDVRASYSQYHSSLFYPTGESFITTSIWSQHNRLLQAGLSIRLYPKLKLSPFADIAIETGIYSEERFLTGPRICSYNTNPPGKFWITGQTLSTGLHRRINQRWFMSSAIGVRVWTHVKLNESEGMYRSQPRWLVSEDLLNIGMAF